MSLLHDAYTALLSGLTHRTGKEINWHDSVGNPITVEPINVESESYVVRYYREDGGLWREENYMQSKLHGKYRWRYPNGQLHWEEDYVNGQRHGKFIWWHENGQEHVRENYVDGKPHGKSMWWHEDGTLRYEYYYIHGHTVTLEEWDGHNDATT